MSTEKVESDKLTQTEALWPMCLNILGTEEIGDADGEMVNLSQIVEINTRLISLHITRYL